MNHQFAKALNDLIAGKSLSRETTYECMSEILTGRQNPMNQGAFLAAITAKGAAPEEIAGAWRAIFEMDTAKVDLNVSTPVLDNCGTGMDGFKTFNISTAAAITGAAGGVCIARHGARAITSRCGTVDLCESLGVDMECSVDVVKYSIETAGIGLFNGMSAQVHPKALFRILSQICFGSILNVAASLANPANPGFGVRGVYHEDMIDPVIQTMKEIGFQRAMVFHGRTDNGGIDELSPIKESMIAELTEHGDVRKYTVTPEIMGIQPIDAVSRIAGGKDPHTEAIRLLEVFSGKEKDALYATVCLNTAPIFYIAGTVRSLKQGVEKARDVIDSGFALEKVREWSRVQNADPAAGESKLNALLGRIQ
jgi:anthranilate phosphoribosyltransferase